jgi:predicted RNA-binding protein
VYLDADGRRQEVMKDVAAMEAGKDGFMIIDLFGTTTFVRGKIKSLDFVDEPSVLLKENENDRLKK